MAKRKGKEVREVSSVRLEPLQKSLIVEKYGSLTNFLTKAIDKEGLFRCSYCDEVHVKKGSKLIPYDEDTNVVVCASCVRKGAEFANV